MTALSFQHVSKTYPNRVAALDQLSLDVAEGELLVMVGPSGCGKTTALRLVAGLDEPTAGTIRIGDREVNRLAPRHRDVAMVFQHHVLYPHLSVYDNIAFGLRLRGLERTEIENRVAWAAKTLAIDDLLGRRPGELSG
jgi:ABC-type sugar transport system ATPase subunit